ncbi:lysine-specific demethylase 2A isoform X1 [Chlorella sorokiniana]|uniref:Lysine-specific demethylase 2A isoform X1 n=1 Tax=Chlorella sorokiniana TaxID=3076 RepID=A0A2P6TSZ6_CHLSO|nr:lysine-specific demethylase 2A isoform X1 [Chlorella sorokiniana]|eukprot:PRW57186.1 lysine-specific demethylase 2A isoform X1 [Chlorella sorokiniana]
MARKARPVDYRRLAAADLSDLSLGADALGTDFRALHSELLSFGGYRTAGTRSLAAAQLTPEWLQQNGAFRPTLIPAGPAAAKELGIALPEGSLTVDRLASRIGIATEVHTMDVQTQGEGPRWTLHQWCLYWEARRAASREPPPALAAAGGAAGAGGLASGALTGSQQQPGTARAGRPAPAEDEADSAAVKRKRTAEEEAAAQHMKGISAESKKRVLEVSALSLTGTALEAEVSPPAAVSAVDLAQQVWPEGAPSRPSTSVNLVMSPEGAYTDFHLAVGGSSVWLHCLSGRRVLALVPPTPRNLATYVAWAASARYAGVFLPAHCEGVVRLEMGPGDTLIIPGGWAHASATTASAVLLGGSFLRRDALALQLEAWRIEDHLAVRPRFRYPAFKQVLWYAAAAFAKRLQRLSGLPGPELKQRVAERLTVMAQEEAAAAATRGADSQDSDSVSKAGAAKKKKGWLGEQREVADDAGTRRPQQAQQVQEGHETPRSVPTGQRALQPPALGLARAAASPTAAGLPRQIGRAVGGGSRLRTAGGGGGSGKAAARAPASRLNPTQQGIDLRGGGGGGGSRRAAGGGGGGGGFGQRKRQRSPDSFIEQDSGGEPDSDLAGSDEEAEGGVEWAPGRTGAGSGGEDEEMSEPDTDPDIDELAAAGYRHRYAADEEGQAARPRRMTARQAAAAAKEAAAWDGRLAKRTPAAAFDEFDEELLDEDDWEGGGGSGGRRGRQSTRFRGQLPPRMAALLQEEEAEEAEEAAEAAYLAAPHVTTAAAALAAFEAAAQQQPAAVAPAGAAGAGLKPVKIKVKAPAALQPEQQAAAAFPLAAAQQPPASGIKIKIKPAGVQQQAQQAQEPTIPQVDGAGDESGDEAPAGAAAAKGGQDELAAMYDALFDEEPPAQQGAAAAQPQAQQEQLPAALASPLGLQPRGALPAQQAQQPAGSKEEQGQQSEGAAMHRNASLAMWLDGGGATEGRQCSQDAAGFAAGMATANGAAAALAAAQPGAAAVAAAAEEGEEDWDLDPAAPPAEPLSLEEEEGLAALLAALKDWLRKPHALNDVPLTISNPKAVVARLEVCMRELGLSLTPPPQVDFDSVPLERLLPVRTPRAGGLTGTLASHQTPQTAGGSEFVPGELDAVGELEEGGEFDPDDLEEEGEAPVVEESAGPKRKLAPASAVKPAGLAARAGGSAGRPPGAAALAPPAAKRSKASVKERLTKKLGLGKKR